MSETLVAWFGLVGGVGFALGLIMGARWNDPVRRHRAWVQSAEAEEMD